MLSFTFSVGKEEHTYSTVICITSRAEEVVSVLTHRFHAYLGREGPPFPSVRCTSYSRILNRSIAGGCPESAEMFVCVAFLLVNVL